MSIRRYFKRWFSWAPTLPAIVEEQEDEEDMEVDVPYNAIVPGPSRKRKRDEMDDEQDNQDGPPSKKSRPSPEDCRKPSVKRKRDEDDDDMDGPPSKRTRTSPELY